MIRSIVPSGFGWWSCCSLSRCSSSSLVLQIARWLLRTREKHCLRAAGEWSSFPRIRHRKLTQPHNCSSRSWQRLSPDLDSRGWGCWEWRQTMPRGPLRPWRGWHSPTAWDSCCWGREFERRCDDRCLLYLHRRLRSVHLHRGCRYCECLSLCSN